MNLPLYFFNFIKKLKKYLSLESFIFSYIVFCEDGENPIWKSKEIISIYMELEYDRCKDRALCESFRKAQFHETFTQERKQKHKFIWLSVFLFISWILIFLWIYHFMDLPFYGIFFLWNFLFMEFSFYGIFFLWIYLYDLFFLCIYH